MQQEPEAELDFDCPHCGEPNTLDAWSVGRDETVTQDCWVCCRPIELSLQESADGERWVVARAE